MKPARFDYYAPSSLDEALELLDRHGEDARPLAGGQSLVPLLNLRLARPAVVVDLNRVAGLSELAEADGGLRIGAMVRERTVELSPLVRERSPLLAAALPLIGHFQIRNRGTLGGSIAHADPSAELPAVAVALDAEMAIESKGSERTVAAGDFFVSDFTTRLEPTELLTEVRYPAWPSGRGWAIDEVCRREGDFAMVGAVAALGVTEAGACENPRVVLFGVADKPVRLGNVEAALAGRALDRDALDEASALASRDVDPTADVHASAEYRREVAGTLTRRVLAAAWERAQPGGQQ